MAPLLIVFRWRMDWAIVIGRSGINQGFSTALRRLFPTAKETDCSGSVATWSLMELQLLLMHSTIESLLQVLRRRRFFLDACGQFCRRGMTSERKEWLTRTTVPAPSTISMILFFDFSLNRGSPTPSTSSMRQNVRIQSTHDGKCKPCSHARRVGSNGLMKKITKFTEF